MDRSRSAIFAQAAQAYNFPPVTYDFTKGCQRNHPSMVAVENQIRAELTWPSHQAVKEALSNVLYWGYARTGYRDRRVKEFRDNVTAEQLDRAIHLFHSLTRPGHKVAGLRLIAALGLPQFSGMCFVSKVRMFLDPWHYVVLDRKLLSLRTQPYPTLFRELNVGQSEVMIRITQHNEAVYTAWSQQCLRLSETHLGHRRAVDVERATPPRAGLRSIVGFTVATFWQPGPRHLRHILNEI